MLLNWSTSQKATVPQMRIPAMDMEESKQKLFFQQAKLEAARLTKEFTKLTE